MRGPWSQFANQHSYVLIALVVLIVAAAVSLRLRRQVRIALLGGGLAIFAAVFAVLRIGAGDIRAAADLDAALGDGRPVIVELYSNYCIACLGAKPVFDDLERELAGRASFLRANFQSAAGKELARRYNVDTVPTFLAFARDGRLQLRLEGDPGVPVSELRSFVNAAK